MLVEHVGVVSVGSVLGERVGRQPAGAQIGQRFFKQRGDGGFAVFDGMVSRHFEIRADQSGDAVRDLPRVGLRQIRQHDDRHARPGKPQDVRGETLQMAAVLVIRRAVLLADEPTETVRK